MFQGLLSVTSDVAASSQGGVAPWADLEVSATEPLEFNGSESLNLGRSGAINFADGDFTVHITVKFASLGDPNDMSLVDKMSSPIEVNNDGWRLLKQADNRFWFCLGGGESNGCDPSAQTTVISQTLAEPEVWHSVTAVKSSELIHIYVDGILEGTSELGPFTNTDSADLRVGANDPEGAFLIGSVRNVSLFRQALNSGQVSAQHARTIPR
jgi:hypothetical protein